MPRSHKSTVREKRTISGWQAVGATVLGASHRRNGKRNQDAVRCWPTTGASAVAIVAVADGHGTDRCSRSADGAKFAVEVAIGLAKATLTRGTDAANGTQTNSLGRWPEVIANRWRQMVKQHYNRNPIPVHLAEEFAAATMLDGADPDPCHVYGTTLLMAAATPASIACLQLGDGDLLMVTDEGTVTRPVPGDPRLIANVTTSLSSANAGGDFRVKEMRFAGNPPALMLLSTDGYANSFGTDEDFLKVGSDMLSLVRSDGLAAVSANLKSWLAESSESGSGDDVTLALLCRDDLAGDKR